jgi:hypothetical protein
LLVDVRKRYGDDDPQVEDLRREIGLLGPIPTPAEDRG